MISFTSPPTLTVLGTLLSRSNYQTPGFIGLSPSLRYNLARVSCVKAGYYQTLIPFSVIFHPPSLGLTSDLMLLDFPRTRKGAKNYGTSTFTLALSHSTF